MAPRSWHPRKCSRRCTWAESGNLGDGQDGAFPAHSSPNRKELRTRRGGRGAEGARGWRLRGETNEARIHSPLHRPVGERRSPLAPAPARPQNYLLLPRSPQAKSEEVHSPRRQSGAAGTRVSTQTTLRAGACGCPGAGPTELLGAQEPAERQLVLIWAARGLPRYPELRRARTPIGWRRGACAQGRRAARARGWRWGDACPPPPASPDRHDSRFPQDLEALPPSHLGCGSVPSLASFPPPWRLAPNL